MQPWGIGNQGLSRAGILFLVLNSFNLFQTAQSQVQNLPKIRLTDAAVSVYADDPNDAWNRIFYFLFSRRFEAELSDEFPEGAPFQEPIDTFPNPGVRVSTQVFERVETGDRAIDPLYPSFLTLAGGRTVLREPIYSEFVKVLQEALHQNVTRSPIAKSLMQSDLWAAHDILSLRPSRSDRNELEQHRLVVVDLLAHLIKKTALTPEEIQSLPDNYSMATRKLSFPDVFRKKNGWIEVQWFPRRLHDSAAGYRRTTRVFLKPARAPHDMQKFLHTLPNKPDLTTDLDGVGLITQLLIVDSHGNLRATRLTSEVQMRLFEKSNKAAFSRTILKIYEISRRSLLQQPGGGGLVHEQDNAPAYLPSAGNDYSFASNQLEGPPVQVELKTRCTSCHGRNLTHVMTFSIAYDPGFSPPPVRQLNPTAHEAADFDVSQKEKLEDFKSLRKYFRSGQPSMNFLSPR